MSELQPDVGVSTDFVRAVPPRSLIAHYELLTEIGRGGMGIVYRARDTRLSRMVALKRPWPKAVADPAQQRRFLREARAGARISHPHVVPVFEVLEHDGIPWIAMELVNGSSLRGIIQASHGIPLEELLRHGEGLAGALAAAHANHILHRDVNPNNILIDTNGRALLSDFGLAQFISVPVDEELTTCSGSIDLSGAGYLVGTPGYTSPEQARGEVLDERTDVFSLGAVLYEMSTGRRAFTGSTREELTQAILHGTPPAIAVSQEIPEPLVRITYKALAKKRDDRYQTARDLLADLRALRRQVEYERRPELHTTGSRRPRGHSWRWKLAAAGVLMLLAGAAGYRASHRAPTLTDRDTILLGDFENSTGDAVFDDALKQGLAVQLQQSPFLNVLSDQKINETLRLMGREPGHRLTGAIGRDLCQRAGAKAILAGTVSRLGSEYVIGLNALNCATGDSLVREQVQVGRKEDVLKALGGAVPRVRRNLGESLATIEQYNTPLEDATTTSLEALKLFSRGVQAWDAKGFRAAISFYERAVELDPQFALAYSYLSEQYNNIGAQRLARESITKAYELRERVSERERLVIEANYTITVLRDTEKGVRTLEQCRQIYPRDWPVINDLSGFYRLLGRHEEASARATEARRLEPNRSFSHVAVAFAALALSRLDEVELVLGDEQHRKLDSQADWQGSLQLVQYYLAFLRGDGERMQQLVETKGKHNRSLYVLQANTDVYHGRVHNAQGFGNRARFSDKESTPGIVASLQVWNALQEVEFGYREQARQRAIAALALSNEPNIRVRAAFALARVGDIGRARALVDQLLKDSPQDTMLKGYWVPSIQAAIDLHESHPTKAVQHLEPASRYELGVVNDHVIAPLYPVYLRGQAFLAAHRGREAAGEFQKYIDHPGLALNFHLGALARVGLARAYALQGDTVKARTAYQDFLTLWKDADPGIPVFREAKAEYAKLK